MSVQDVVDYVLQSPQNTNPAILKQMIRENGSDGAVEGYSVAYYNETMNPKLLYHESTNTFQYDYNKFIDKMMLHPMTEGMTREEVIADFATGRGTDLVPSDNAHVLLYELYTSSSNEDITLPLNSDTDVSVRYGLDGYGFVTFYNEAGNVVWRFYADGITYQAADAYNTLNDIYPNTKQNRYFYRDPEHTQEVNDRTMLPTYTEDTNFYIVDTNETTATK